MKKIYLYSIEKDGVKLPEIYKTEDEVRAAYAAEVNKNGIGNQPVYRLLVEEVDEVSKPGIYELEVENAKHAIEIEKLEEKLKESEIAKQIEAIRAEIAKNNETLSELKAELRQTMEATGTEEMLFKGGVAKLKESVTMSNTNSEVLAALTAEKELSDRFVKSKVTQNIDVRKLKAEAPDIYNKYATRESKFVVTIDTQSAKENK